MTQLNLSGSPSTNPQRKTAAEPEGGSIKNQTVGALGALAIFALVIIVGSCSQGKKPAVVQQAAQPSAPVATPVASQPVAPPAPVQAKGKPRNRGAATLSYVNHDYGVAFSFPRKYQLKTGEALTGPGSMDLSATNFAQPGGTTLAAVELPGNSFPGTDFEAAYINLSVNSGMTEQQCSQFASPGANSQGAMPQVVKAGANEFTKVVLTDLSIMDQTGAEYYHAFRNGTCYEFALALATDGKDETGTIKVDQSEVFARLEKILATVKLPAAATVNEEPAASTATTSSSRAEGETRQNF
jgi:hypothetical protein